MLNQLGMSDNILTLIERRSKTDLLILIGLCSLTLIIMYVLYFYVKPMLTLEYIFSGSKAATEGVNQNVTLPGNITSLQEPTI